MEINHFINTVSRIFPSSFTSCQFRPDAIEPSINNPKTTQCLHLSDHFSSITRKSPKNPKRTPLGSSDTNGRQCPLVTRVSGSNLKEKSSKNVIVTHMSSSSNSGLFTDAETNTFFSLSSAGSYESFTESSWRKSDIKNITSLGHCALDQSSRKTTKSSRNPVQESPKTIEKTGKNVLMKPKKIVPEGGFEVSGFSTELYYSNSRTARRKTSRKTRKTNPRGRTTNSLRMDWVGKSYAMEKCSKDPKSDFRASMVEMIVEKQIFGGYELEKLLHCFLSLNEASYHGIIFEVFTEICETLFRN